MLSAGENMTYLFLEFVGGMRKFIPAMSIASVRRVGLCRYRTGAKESAGADSASETSTPPGAPQARRRAPRSGAKEKKGGKRDLSVDR